MERYPSNPTDLTPQQNQVREAFWQSVRIGQRSGARAIATRLGLSSRSTDNALQVLRVRKLIPPRPQHSTLEPLEWKMLVPEEFGPLPEPEVKQESVKEPPRRVFPDHIELADVGHPYGDLQERVKQLEQELEALRSATKWLTHSSDVGAMKGGTLTIATADQHLFDRNHLLNSHKSMEQKVATLIDQFQPRRLQVICDGDLVTGRGIFKRQDLELILPDAEQQAAGGAYRFKETYDLWHSHLNAGAEELYYLVQGNHDQSDGSSLCMKLTLALRTLGVPIRFMGNEFVVDLSDAQDGELHHMALVEHGYGASAYSPSSNRQVFESYRKIVSYSQRGYSDSLRIRRVIHGHTHWLSVDLERAEDLKFDCIGGLHKNSRSNIGSNTRPCGWVSYLSPFRSAEILTPMQITPATEAFRSDMDDPLLPERNRAEAARCLSEWTKWAIEHGIIGATQVVAEPT